MSTVITACDKKHSRHGIWILITLQFKPEELSDLYSATDMSVCADANITGTFLHFWTHKVHYKLQQRTLQNFDDGGLCPRGLQSGVGIFSGLLSGGLMSGGLLSVHR